MHLKYFLTESCGVVSRSSIEINRRQRRREFHQRLLGVPRFGLDFALVGLISRCLVIFEDGDAVRVFKALRLNLLRGLVKWATSRCNSNGRLSDAIIVAGLCRHDDSVVLSLILTSRHPDTAILIKISGSNFDV